ncbi:MAG: CpaF family protein [Anaerolineae bacterium]|nr:CpaF family protein [Anaerolineae bacterium]
MNEFTVSLGPLDALFQDPDVSEIMVNGYDRVFVERRRGAYEDLEEVPDIFRDEAELQAVIDIFREIAESLGRRLDAKNPLVDVRLGQVARANVVLPPISTLGPTITIRKFGGRFFFPIEDLIRFGSWTEDMVAFLRACIKNRLNIVVAGGTGSGKTTILNVLSGMIDPGERVITVENAMELQPPDTLRHLVRLESRPPDHTGEGEVSIQQLIVNALRMRPDRLLLGEARSAEVLEIMQAINTGHDGTMFSIHASSVRDVLLRLEMMCSMHGIAFPLLTIRHMIAEAVDLITYQERLPDGRRKLTRIAEVVGMQGDMIAVQDIFEFRQTGTADDGTIEGYFTATGKLPTFIERIQGDLPMEIFRPK